MPKLSGEWMPSVNPATEEIHGRVPAGTAADVDRAVEAGLAAQVEWAKVSVWERGEIIRELANAIEARADEIVGRLNQSARLGRNVLGGIFLARIQQLPH